MTMIKRLLLFMLMGLVLLSACAKVETQRMRIGTNVWPGYEPLYVARSQGWLESERFRLIEYPSASEVIRAFRNKTLEAASLTLDEVLLLSEAQVPVKIVLVQDISNGADVIIARQGLKDIKSLKGRRIGVESGALGAYVLTRALETHGLSLADVEVINMDVNLHEGAFSRGQVDAVVTFEPVRTRLLSMGGHEVFSSREIPGEIVDVLVVHEDYLRDYAGNVQLLMERWFQALEYKQQHPEQYARISSRRLKVSAEEVLASYSGLVLPSREENLRMMSGTDSRLQKDLVEIRRVLEQHELIEKGVAIENMLAPLGQ